LLDTDGAWQTVPCRGAAFRGMTGPLRGSAGERTLVGFTYLFPTATASRGLATTSTLHCALNQDE
jgi:hypothetical protein